MQRRLFFLLLTFLVSLAKLSAHQIDLIEMQLIQENSKWKLVGWLDVGYMTPEIRRIVEAPPVYRAEVMDGSREYHEKIMRDTEDTMRSLITLQYKGNVIPWTIRFPDFEKEPLQLRVEAGDWALIHTEISIEARSDPGELTLSWNDELGCQLLIAHPATETQPYSAFPIQSGSSATLLVVKPVSVTNAEVTATTSEKEQASNWFISGFRHVIPLGLDHLLFIIGISLLAPRWKSLLGQSLLFTLAHSITLALSVLSVVVLPSRMIEIAIAASIAWIGIENIWLKKVKKSRIFLIFAFGLLHGMGFASVLKEQISGLSGPQLTVPLLGFNLGVEIAQITVIALVFALMQILKKWRNHIQLGGSLLIALAGLYWVFERIAAA